MNICFIGYGSIAKRHIKNIIDLYSDVKIDILRHTNRKEFITEFEGNIEKVVTSVDALDEHYDAVFITNPTSMHYETLKMMHNFADNFFIEKPVFEKCDKNLEELQLRDDANYYVACPLRYSNVIQWLKKNIVFNDVYSMRVISSSYLPDWRPNVDYRETYSAKKEQGGGVAIDLIHEWDYIFYLIGAPCNVKSIISKKSNLEITSDDLAVYVAEYPDKIVELHLDYFGRYPLRKIELFTADDTVEADLINNTITFMKSGRGLELTENRDAYQKRELKHFFAIAEGKVQNDNTIKEACDILRIAKGL